MHGFCDCRGCCYRMLLNLGVKYRYCHTNLTLLGSCFTIICTFLCAFSPKSRHLLGNGSGVDGLSTSRSRLQSAFCSEQVSVVEIP